MRGTGHGDGVGGRQRRPRHLKETPMKIDYMTEPVDEYNKALDSAADAQSLRDGIKKFYLIAWDAMDVAMSDEFDFKEFKAGLKKERKQKFSGEDWMSKYGNILIPDMIVHVATVSSKCRVPFGCAYIRMKGVGLIDDSDGKARIVREDDSNG